MKKIGRNQICPLCDSGKKYKKCCMAKSVEKDEVKREVERVLDSITKLDEIDAKKHFSFDKRVPTVRRVENLPTEIKSKVIQMVNDKRFRVRGCWFNSTLIATEIEGVEKVDGWYGIKTVVDPSMESDLINAEKELSHKSNYKQFIKRLDKRVWAVKNIDRFVVFDFEKDLEYSRHSWNSYKGIHFDVSGQYSSREELGFEADINYRWIEYIEFGKDTSIYLNGDRAELTQSIANLKIQTNKTFSTIRAA